MRVLSGVAVALTVAIAPVASAQQPRTHGEHTQQLDQLIQQLEQIGDERLRGNVSEQEYQEFQGIVQRLRDAKTEEHGAGAKMIPGPQSLEGVERAGQPEGMTLQEIVLRKSTEGKINVQTQQSSGQVQPQQAKHTKELASALQQGEAVNVCINNQQQVQQMTSADIVAALNQGNQVRILALADSPEPHAHLIVARQVEEELNARQQQQDPGVAPAAEHFEGLHGAVEELKEAGKLPQQVTEEMQQAHQQQGKQAAPTPQHHQGLRGAIEQMRESDPNLQRRTPQAQQPQQQAAQQQQPQQPPAQEEDAAIQRAEQARAELDAIIAAARERQAQERQARAQRSQQQQDQQQVAQDQPADQQQESQAEELRARLEQLMADEQEAAAREQQRRQGQQQARAEQPEAPQIGVITEVGPSGEIAVKFQNPQLRQQLSQHQKQRVNLVATIDTENGQTVAHIESVSPAGNN